jgi:hypothetical protein
VACRSGGVRVCVWKGRSGDGRGNAPGGCGCCTAGAAVCGEARVDGFAWVKTRLLEKARAREMILKNPGIAREHFPTRQTSPILRDVVFRKPRARN